MYFTRRVTAIAASSVVSLGILSAVVAVPAESATPDYCSGDVCAQVVSIASSGFGIDAWAWKTTFFGHFELTSPNGTHYNEPMNADITNSVGARQHFHVPQVDGGYTVIAWQWVSKGNNKNIGQVGFSVHLGRALRWPLRSRRLVPFPGFQPGRPTP
jgi:hypothetical protein